MILLALTLPLTPLVALAAVFTVCIVVGAWLRWGKKATP